MVGLVNVYQHSCVTVNPFQVCTAVNALHIGERQTSLLRLLKKLFSSWLTGVRKKRHDLPPSIGTAKIHRIEQRRDASCPGQIVVKACALFNVDQIGVAVVNHDIESTQIVKAFNTHQVVLVTGTCYNGTGQRAISVASTPFHHRVFVLNVDAHSAVPIGKINGVITDDYVDSGSCFPQGLLDQTDTVQVIGSDEDLVLWVVRNAC